MNRTTINSAGVRDRRAAHALGSLSAAQAAHVTYPKRGAAFVGFTSQKSGTVALPVDLRASPSGHVMNRLDLQWAATCQGAGGTGSYGGLSVTPGKKILAPVGFTDANTFTRTLGAGSVATST